VTVLRYNNVHARLAVALTDSATTITLDTALQEGGVNVPTLSGGDTILLGIDDEILELTAYTAGTTTGTVTRGNGDTLAAAHDVGARVANVITKDDARIPYLGGKLIRYQDTGSPVTIPAVTTTILTETLMDAEDGTVAGVAWSNANNRFDVTQDGLFRIRGQVTWDSSGLSAGQGKVVIGIRADGSAFDAALGPDLPFTSGADMEAYLDVTTFIEAGGYIDLEVYSSVSVDITYAELLIRRLA
jgi:hypothetical protein